MQKKLKLSFRNTFAFLLSLLELNPRSLEAVHAISYRFSEIGYFVLTNKCWYEINHFIIILSLPVKLNLCTSSFY